jgi:hypothetical protein
MDSRIRFPIAATAALAALFVAAPAAHAALIVQDFETGASADGIAQTLAGQGVSISNVSYTGSNRSAGSFSGGDGIIGFGSGVILNSGKARTDATDDPCEVGVEGPNNCNEDIGGDNSTGFGLPGDADLTALSTSTGGGPTEDASILEFDFVPTANRVTFNYVFSSDEYNNFANSSFNDVFAFFVNGVNCATVPGTGEPVSINTINNGDPGGDPTPHNPQLYVDNVRPTPTLDTQMDGLTTVLPCNANVTAGQLNHMKLAIADASDDALDSAVFIQAGSLTSVGELALDITGRKRQKPVGPQVKPANRAKHVDRKLLSVRVTCTGEPCNVDLKGNAKAGGEKVKFRGPDLSLEPGQTQKVRLAGTPRSQLAQLKAALKDGENGKAKVTGSALNSAGQPVTDSFNVKLRGR